MKTIEELLNKKKRLIGKRNQMMEQGTPATMMMALDMQNQIDDIVEELNKRKYDSGYYSAYLEQEFDTHGFEYVQKKYPVIVMCGSCKIFPHNMTTTEGACDWNVKAFEEACSKEYVKR